MSSNRNATGWRYWAWFFGRWIPFTKKHWAREILDATSAKAERDAAERKANPRAELFGFMVLSVRGKGGGSVFRTDTIKPPPTICHGCGEEQKPRTRMVGIRGGGQAVCICPKCVATAVTLADIEIVQRR